MDFYLSCWHFSLLIKWAWVLSCVHNSQCSQSLMFFWRYRKVRSWFCRTSVRWRITTLEFLSKILIWTQNVFRVGGVKGVAAFGCWCLHSTGGCAWLLFLLCLKVLTPTIRHNIPQAGDCSHDDIQRWYLDIVCNEWVTAANCHSFYKALRKPLFELTLFCFRTWMKLYLKKRVFSICSACQLCF